MEHWTNKVAIITNSRNEIGINIIEKLGEMGMTVIGLCKTKDELKLVTVKFNESIVTIDADNVDEVKDVFENIVHNYGSIDVLVNIINSDCDCEVLEGCLDDFQKIIDTNVSEIAWCIRKAAGYMLEKQTRGHIITISDCTRNNTLFTMTKAAVSSMNEILRHEFRYLNASIKTTHIEIEHSALIGGLSPNKSYKTKDLAEMVYTTVLNTSKNMHVHELWLCIGN